MSETTEIKGQFGLDQSGGTGKKLKIYLFYRMSLSKHENLKFTNAVYHLHDLICPCEKGIKHSIQILLNQTKNEFSTTDIKDIQKCLGTTPTEEDGVADGIDFGDDLEKLFAADTEEDTTG